MRSGDSGTVGGETAVGAEAERKQFNRQWVLQAVILPEAHSKLGL